MRRLGGRAGVVGLTAFLVLDVVLVAAALNRTAGAVAGAGTVVGSAQPGPTTTATSPAARATRSASTTSSPSATGSTTTTAAGAVPVVPLSVGVVAIGPRTALRFTTGDCSSGSRLELTRDGGSSWASRSKPFDSVLRIRVRSDGSAFALGVDGGTDCAVALSHAGAYDGSWGGASSASASWYRDPRDAAQIAMPSARRAAPCGRADGMTVVDLAVTDSGAAVLCSDGRVRTSRSGTTWSTAATVPGALALTMSTQGTSYYVAVPGVGGCEGVAVVEVSAPSTAQGCAQADASGLEPGTVALAVTSDSGWLRLGDATYRSNGTLRSWQKS